MDPAGADGGHSAGRLPELDYQPRRLDRHLALVIVDHLAQVWDGRSLDSYIFIRGLGATLLRHGHTREEPTEVGEGNFAVSSRSELVNYGY